MRDVIESLCQRRDLPREQTRALFGRVLSGDVSELDLCALLIALKAKGETPDEIAGAAEALRAAALPFDIGEHRAADTCGTGGDGAGTVNVSTACGLLVAELGIPVVKHGNRSVSSRCGSADVLERCGLKIDAAPAVSRRCLDQEGICFLFAPQYHAGVRHAMPVRRGLGLRTIFNMIGPLANPGRPAVQLVGVYDPALVVPVARTLGLLGVEAALVVHGGGLDEIALHAPTTAALAKHGEVQEVTLTPEEVGATRRPLSALAGGDAAQNAHWLTELLAGRGDEAHQQAVALNAGAVAWIAGRARDLRQGYEQALAALASGGAAERLARWARLSQENAGDAAS